MMGRTCGPIPTSASRGRWGAQWGARSSPFQAVTRHFSMPPPIIASKRGECGPGCSPPYGVSGDHTGSLGFHASLAARRRCSPRFCGGARGHLLESGGFHHHTAATRAAPAPHLRVRGVHMGARHSHPSWRSQCRWKRDSSVPPAVSQGSTPEGSAEAGGGGRGLPTSPPTGNTEAACPLLRGPWCPRKPAQTED